MHTNNARFRCVVCRQRSHTHTHSQPVTKVRHSGTARYKTALPPLAMANFRVQTVQLPFFGRPERAGSVAFIILRTANTETHPKWRHRCVCCYWLCGALLLAEPTETSSKERSFVRSCAHLPAAHCGRIVYTLHTRAACGGRKQRHMQMCVVACSIYKYTDARHQRACAALRLWARERDVCVSFLL